MSILSNSIYGTSTNKGVGGLLSGLDTDELVNQMAAGTRNKINRAYQSKQKLLYRQEAYRGISSKLLAFSNKYLSFSSSSKLNILSSDFFKSNDIKSSSEYVTVLGKAENIKNFSITNISSVATSASFTSTKTVSNQFVSSTELTEYTSSLAGETMSIEYDGKTYNLTIDKDFGKGLKNESAERPVKISDVVAQLNEQIAKIKDLKDEDGNPLLEYKVDGDKIVIESSKGKTAKLSAASNTIIEVLGMEVGEIASSQSNIDSDKLTKTATQVLSNEGAYITFEYNGVQKKVFLNSEDEKIKTNVELKNHLQTQLNKLYGDGKIVVDLKDGKLKFETNDEVPEGEEREKFRTNIFGISSISKELSNYIGIESSTYNRFSNTKPISEAGISSLEKADVYKIEINDVEMEFDSSMSVTDIINKINNNAEAGVKIFYSSTTDTFTVRSAETGVDKKVVIKDVLGNGNLATALFGSGINNALQKQSEGEYVKYEGDNVNVYKLVDGKEEKIGTATYNNDNKQYTITYDDDVTEDKILNVDYSINKGSDTVMSYTLNGISTTVTRSTANFTIDGMNISLNEKAKGSVEAGKPVTFTVNSNTDEIVEKVRDFINEYNEIITLISSKTSERPKRDYLPLTPEQMDEMETKEIEEWTAEAKKGVLYGDSKMQNVLYSLRGAMSGKTDVSSLLLSEIGISAGSMDRTGKLNFDEEKFKEKLAQNPDEVAALFSGKGSSEGEVEGIAYQLQSILRANVGYSGTAGILIDEAGLDNGLTSDKNFISERMEEYDEAIEKLKKTLETEKERYWKKFSALEQALSNLNAQSSWLTDMMGGN